MSNTVGMDIAMVYGVKLEKIKELIDLFEESGYSLEKDFDSIKKHDFNKTS